MITTYLPVFIAILLASLLGVTFLILPKILVPYHTREKKNKIYECGIPPTGDARQKFMPHFYLIGAIFILFDIEVVFLYPCAVLLKKLGIYGIIEMFLFIGILMVGYIYIWRKKAIEWQ